MERKFIFTTSEDTSRRKPTIHMTQPAMSRPSTAGSAVSPLTKITGSVTTQTQT